MAMVSRKWFIAVIGAAVIIGAGYFLSLYTSTGVYDFQYTRKEMQNFIGMNDGIKLTADEEKIRLAALDEKDSSDNPLIPAPCCSKFTAATCCCECNLKRAIGGLSKMLIKKENDAMKVRSAVQTWLAGINPSGYKGDACFVGGCNKSPKEDGCGGMEKNHLVF